MNKLDWLTPQDIYYLLSSTVTQVCDWPIKLRAGDEGPNPFPQVRVGSYNVICMYLITQMYSYNVIDMTGGTGGAVFFTSM